MATDLTPRFTVTMRGYDKSEVDEYLESLAVHANDADGELTASRQHQRELESEVARLRARVGELEDAIRSETPHTVRAIGERITLILSEAEAGATDTLAQAQSRAEQLVTEAREEAEELHRRASEALAEAQATSAEAHREAEEHLARTESEARARATAILGEAEARARRRQAQIEGWAQEVIAATQADQAQMAEEFALVRRRHEAELADLLSRRDEVVAGLRDLQLAITQAVERVPVPPAASRYDQETPEGDEVEGYGDFDAGWAAEAEGDEPGDPEVTGEIDPPGGA